MRRLGVQGMHPRRSVQNQANPRVAVTVDSPFVTLGHAKPALPIEVVPDRFLLLLADEEAGKDAEHHPGHALADRILGLLELSDHCRELLRTLREILRTGLEGRGHLRNHRDGVSDDLLLVLDFIEAPLDASGPAAELLLREPPLFAPQFRSIDSATAWRASAIRNPGGGRGPLDRR
jgi:hypothetical protein